MAKKETKEFVAATSGPSTSKPLEEKKEKDNSEEPTKVLKPKKVQEPVQEVKTEIPCTFYRWFKTKGFKPHWKKGMEAFANTAGKKVPSEWDRIFKVY